MFKLLDKKINTIYPQKFCLTGPMDFIYVLCNSDVFLLIYRGEGIRIPLKAGHHPLARETPFKWCFRQICSIKPEDVARVRSSELLAKLQLEDLDLILRERRFRWFGHVEHSSGAIKTEYDMQIDGKRGAGRPKQTWKKLTEKGCREWKLTTVDPQERSTWRSGVRSAMRAASQLPGKGPTDVDDAPAPAC